MRKWDQDCARRVRRIGKPCWHKEQLWAKQLVSIRDCVCRPCLDEREKLSISPAAVIHMARHSLQSGSWSPTRPNGGTIQPPAVSGYTFLSLSKHIHYIVQCHPSLPHEGSHFLKPTTIPGHSDTLLFPKKQACPQFLIPADGNTKFTVHTETVALTLTSHCGSSSEPHHLTLELQKARFI